MTEPSPEQTEPSQEEPKKRKKVLANIKSPVISAILNRRYTFTTEKDAEAKIEFIQERFVRSSYGQEDEENPRTILWIRGYDVTEDEKKAGCIGNYAIIYIDATMDGKFTIAAQKVIADPSRHPQRKRKKSKHPDWGYWVLRRIKKNWRYDSIDEAYADLMQLAEDFPEVSIPAQNKLYTIIYRKMPDDSLPLFRVILEVEALREGGFTITCKENTFKRKEDKVKKEVVAEEEEKQPMGRFTSMVEVKRNKRKNIADYKPNDSGE